VRLLIGSVLGIVIAWATNEVTFHFLRSPSSRAPQEISLPIPPGTAERIEGGDGAPLVPSGMVFVVGDTLVVENHDTVNHELGPLFIPAGSRATLRLEAAEKYSYSCTFTPSKSFGLDVQPPVTGMTRLVGAVLAGLPLGMLIALYSLVASPGRSKGTE